MVIFHSYVSLPEDTKEIKQKKTSLLQWRRFREVFSWGRHDLSELWLV